MTNEIENRNNSFTQLYTKKLWKILLFEYFCWLMLLGGQWNSIKLYLLLKEEINFSSD